MYLVAKSGTNLDPIDLSSCSIVCSVQQTVLSFQEYFAIDCLDFSDVPPMPPTCLVGPFDAPPQYRHLVVKSGTTAGQHDMWSTCGSGWCLVKCTPSPPNSLVKASSGQEQYYIRSAWHLVSLWIRLTCLFEDKSGASTHGTSSSTSRY